MRAVSEPCSGRAAQGTRSCLGVHQRSQKCWAQWRAPVAPVAPVAWGPKEGLRVWWQPFSEAVRQTRAWVPDGPSDPRDCTCHVFLSSCRTLTKTPEPSKLGWSVPCRSGQSHPADVVTFVTRHPLRHPTRRPLHPKGFRPITHQRRGGGEDPAQASSQRAAVTEQSAEQEPAELRIHNALQALCRFVGRLVKRLEQVQAVRVKDVHGNYCVDR
jgi:hypothetical protein